MALEYESNTGLVGAIKAPLGALGSDKNYRQVLYETIAEQVEGLGRRPNANYNVGEVVYPSSNLQYALTCTTEGTSDTADLDISANTEGDTITDGTVVWKVVKRNYLESDGVLPVANGGTGATTADVARSNLGINSSIGINPVGTIIAYAANGSIPDGYLPCNGAAVSRATYAALFEVIGTLYGAGDGDTTFNLPDLTDRFLEGSSTAGNYIEAGLPNITGYHNFMDNNGVHLGGIVAGGAFKTSSMPYGTGIFTPNSGGDAKQIEFNASNFNSIYGNSDTVQPYSLTTTYIIKY